MNAWQILGYAGLIPFIACLYLDTTNISWHLSFEQVFIIYSAIILSFLAGSLWRINKNNTSASINIISNVFSLLAFSSLLIPSHIALIVLAISFLILFLYENYLCKLDNISDNNYIKMRLKLTLIVIFLHTFGIILWF